MAMVAMELSVRPSMPAGAAAGFEGSWRAGNRLRRPGASLSRGPAAMAMELLARMGRDGSVAHKLLDAMLHKIMMR